MVGSTVVTGLYGYILVGPGLIGCVMVGSTVVTGLYGYILVGRWWLRCNVPPLSLVSTTTFWWADGGYDAMSA